VDAANGRKITVKDLSRSDRRNFVAAISEIVVLVSSISLNILLLGGGDEKFFQKHSRRAFMALFNRFQGDVFFIYNLDNWKYFEDNLIPAASMLMQAGDFMGDVGNYLLSFIDPTFEPKAKYAKDDLYAKQGVPKFLISATRLAPAGSAQRFLIKHARIQIMKNTKPDAMFMSQLDPAAFRGVDTTEMSKWDVVQLAYQWKRVRRDMELAYIYLTLQKKGIDPEMYYDAMIGKALLEKTQSEIEDALRMSELQIMIDQGEMDATMKEIRKYSKEMRKAEAGRIADPKKVQKERGKKAGEDIKEINEIMKYK
jgi:hypothetical protein